LSRHPAIAAFRPFDTDARVATYWMSVLQDLSQPKSYVQQLNPDDVRAEAWWLGSGSTATRSVMDPELAGWLGRGAVEELAAVCRSRIDAFYSHAAVPGTRFFVEKVHPGRSIPELVTELYEGTREIILVRDFRDILCSITAFDEKRGFRAFGRESASSDEEYVVSSLRPSAEALVHRRDHAGSRALVVRYEELVTDPGGTITRLLSDLGVEHDGETVDRMVAATEPTSVLDHHQTSPSAESSIGRWQRDLSPDLADLCDAELGWALREFGYETSLEGSRAMLTS
jgi:hypothetical protein